jgi:indolepyruvate ferredoxin oxidoreductase
MVKHATTLDDKYTQTEGRILISSVQSLVRLPMVQKQRDSAAGLNTAGYITGYRGSPIGVYDAALWGAKDHLAANEIQFIPGVNEELAAATLRGTQQLQWYPKPKYDGIFSIYYAKMLGIDRAHEALKMGNLEGAAEKGGVLVIAADDHGGKSSATAQGSDQSLIGAMIPVLYPSNTQEFIRFGLLGIAMSRFTGLYVGFKCTSDTLEATASVAVDDEFFEIVTPKNVEKGNGLNILQNEKMPIPQEQKVMRLRLPAAKAFARANAIDRVAIDSRQRRLGIVTAGKAYLDLRQALADIGIDDSHAAKLGIRIYKLGMIWPLEPEGLREFVKGHEEILVIEEKRAIIEEQIALLLYNEPDPACRPRLVGKTNPDGRMLIPADGETTPAMLVDVIAARLEALGVTDAALTQVVAKRKEALLEAVTAPGSALIRTPYFCSGCPHNTSTQHPEGTVNFAGVGCHALAHFMPQRKTEWAAQMGAEGTLWVGLHRFTDIAHVFQNLGDGTYFHSGSLAIRAAIASGANITYKLLYNDAIAMTGGQPIDGTLTIDMMARQVAAEGVQKIVIVTDEPDKYPDNVDWPRGLTIHHRRDLIGVQDELAQITGVTALIYDQTCAAEKRRRRKRGLMVDPDKRAFINAAVCEGCGDCSTKSNCLSVQPYDTPMGRKRRIDQSSCNKDFSCVEGFCPSFVTLKGAKPRKVKANAANDRTAALFAQLVEPKPAALNQSYGVLITGIGGTGVLTVGAILAMAAHIEGKGCSVMDMTGMAQKGGAVLSHLQIAPSPSEIYASRIGVVGSSLVIGCDLVVTAGMDAMRSMRKGQTKVVVNSSVTPTAQFQNNADISFTPDTLISNVASVAGTDNVASIAATALATRLMGDSIATNLFMVGFAAQQGLLPLSIATIEEAIRLNGVALAMNLQAFNWGRVAASNPSVIEEFLNEQGDRGVDALPETLDMLIDQRASFLKDYQNRSYADRFLKIIAAVRAHEQAISPGSEILTATAARTLSRTMAYKDEYEVARLQTSPAFKAEIEAAFEGDVSISYNLAPPLFAKRDKRTGHLIKQEFGPWMKHGFAALARMKGLRGTALDPFGYTAERKMERSLIDEVEGVIERILGVVTPDQIPNAVALLAAYQDIRGYGHIKEDTLARVRERLGTLEAAVAGSPAPDRVSQPEMA